MINVILTVVILAILALAASYIIRAKKRGEHCIGCPYAKECGGNCGCGNNK